MSIFSETIIHQLKNGGIGVIPTDTLYGLVGSALHSETVERIYSVRKRDLDKPFIILIADISDLNAFGVQVSEQEKEYLHTWWPGKVSVILSVEGEKFRYLHRGRYAIAFRFPDDDALRELLKQIGPLVAPSANPKSKEPAKTIEEAKAYFGNDIDFYIDGGRIECEPSTLVKFEDEKPVILRQGAAKIS